MLRRNDVHGGFAEHIVADQAEFFAGDAVAVDYLSIEIQNENGVAGTFEQGLVAVGRSHQGFDGADVKRQAAKIGVIVLVVAVAAHFRCFVSVDDGSFQVLIGGRVFPRTLCGRPRGADGDPSGFLSIRIFKVNTDYAGK